LLVNIDRWVSSVFLSSCNGVPLIALVYLFFYVLSAIRSWAINELYTYILSIELYINVQIFVLKIIAR
jgi:ABC-type amino acid transport system permease subunit